MKLQLYYYEQCPFCHMVLMHIKKLGLENSIEFKNTLENPENRNFHQAKTGRTTVPCLYIDDEPMFESRDIMQWLSDNENHIKGN